MTGGPAPTTRAPWWSLAAPPLFAAGVWILATDVPGWNVVWYLFAWYAWLLALDGAVYLLSGRSWLVAQRRVLPALLLWSVPFWYLYEAYNLRLENWYYVFALHSDRLQFVVSVLAFATVLPACLLHAELAAALGPFARLRWRPLAVGRGVEITLAVLAVTSLVAPLVWPRWAFPLVWGVTLWLPELVNWRRGGTSLLRDLAGGRPQRLLELLAGGMLAGLVWELFNFWARCKWIYTVPFLDRLKLFEMPLLGFLGFPVLAVGAFATWSLRSPGGAAVAAKRRSPLRRGTRVVAVLVGVLACCGVYQRVREQTLRSRRPLLAELPGLGADGAAALARAGIASPERLESAVASRGVSAVAAATALPTSKVALAARQAALALHKGMGTRAAALLEAAGVPDVATLGRQDPVPLAARLRALADRDGSNVPRYAEVAVWVQAARGRTRPRR